MGPSNVAHKGKRNRGFKEERFFFYREKSSFLRGYFFPSGLHRPCHGVLFFAPFLIVVRLHIPLSTLSIVNFSDYCRIGTTATSFHSTKCRFTILPLSSTTFRYVSRGRRKEICVLLRVSLSFLDFFSTRFRVIRENRHRVNAGEDALVRRCVREREDRRSPPN